jgi:hypothetical protein
MIKSRRACSTHGKELHIVQEGAHLENPDVDTGCNLKMDLRQMEQGSDGINLAKSRVQWLSVLNTIMNIRLPWSDGNVLRD